MEDNGIKSGNHGMEPRKLWHKCLIRDRDFKECPDLKVLAAYLDHRLSENESEAVEAHLLYCDECLDALVGVREALNGSEDSISEARMRRIFDLVPESKGILHHIRDILSDLFALPVLPRPLAAACILLICLAGFFAGMKTGMDEKIYYSTMAVELQFSLGMPDRELFGEDG